jgi:hypothetical protein
MDHARCRLEPVSTAGRMSGAQPMPRVPGGDEMKRAWTKGLLVAAIATLGGGGLGLAQGASMEPMSSPGMGVQCPEPMMSHDPMAMPSAEPMMSADPMAMPSAEPMMSAGPVDPCATPGAEPSPAM